MFSEPLTGQEKIGRAEKQNPVRAGAGTPFNRKQPLMLPDRWKTPRKKIFILLVLFLSAGSFSWAQPFSENLEMVWKNRQLQIKAQDVDLKLVLSRLARVTHISIRFPASLQKKVTLERSRMSMVQALEILLRGIDHVVVYSGPNAKKARVNEVLVLTTAKAKRPRPGNPVDNRLKRQIKSYQRQMDSLKLRLSKIDENSRQGKQIQRNISRLEKRLQQVQD